jgi:hypothetical protein
MVERGTAAQTSALVNADLDPLLQGGVQGRGMEPLRCGIIRAMAAAAQCLSSRSLYPRAH